MHNSIWSVFKYDTVFVGLLCAAGLDMLTICAAVQWLSWFINYIRKQILIIEGSTIDVSIRNFTDVATSSTTQIEKRGGETTRWSGSRLRRPRRRRNGKPRTNSVGKKKRGEDWWVKWENEQQKKKIITRSPASKTVNKRGSGDELVDG